VISLLSLTYDLRTFSEPVELSNAREESPGNSTLNDFSDGVATGRDARDVGSASFAANVYPVQVDLTKWTRKFEEKFGDLTKLVDLRFKALNSLVKGLEGKIDAMDHRHNETEKQISTRIEEVKDQFESRLNDSEARMKELEARVNDSRLTEISDSSSSSDGWILILKHNFLDKNAFKHKLWEDYKHEFGDRVNEYWLGLQRMHNITKNGRWYLKIEVKYDLGESNKPSSRQGKTGVGVWKSFSVASEEEEFILSFGLLIEKENMGDNDPLHSINGNKFSTEDHVNDIGFWRPGVNLLYHEDCAVFLGGGWWHNGGTAQRDCSHFCGTCQRDLHYIWYDGTDEKPSESSMWIKQEKDNCNLIET